METVNILANFWGWFLIIPCLIYLFKKKTLEEIFQLSENKVFLLVSGYLAFLIGLVSLILYNSWESNWKVVITIFGWISLIKGVIAIGFPEIIQKTVEKFKRNPLLTKVSLVIGIILGAFLLWVS